MIPSSSGVTATRPTDPQGAPARRGGPTQLPSTPPTETGPSFDVDLSDQAKKLAAFRTITTAPVAVAAVSDNSTVDQVATTVYLSQQANAAIDTYRDATPDYDSGSSDQGGSLTAKLAVASAATDNERVDELATTAYLSRQALQAVDRYSEAYQAAAQQQSTTVDETA